MSQLAALPYSEACMYTQGLDSAVREPAPPDSSIDAEREARFQALIEAEEKIEP